MLCEKGLSMWQGIYESLKKNERTYDEYENLLLAASYSGMAISHTSTTLPHGMSYSLTYEHGVPHGKAVGMFLAAYVDAADDGDRNNVLSLLGYKTCSELKEAIRELVGEVCITKEQMESYADAILSNKKKLSICPYHTDETVIKKIFAESLPVR